MVKKREKHFFLSIYDNSYTNRKALVELIRTMLFLKLYMVLFGLKRQKTE
jgi:hypothetical protein